MTRPIVDLETLLTLIANGGLRFDNRPLFQLILPSNAGPGEARLILGSDLPPPLDTYTFTYIGDTKGPETAIIWYRASPTNDDFNFAAQFSFVSGEMVVFGSVLDGVVLEENWPDFDVFGEVGPSGFVIVFDGGGTVDFFSTARITRMVSEFHEILSLRHVVDEQATASTRALGTYANLTNIAGTAFVAPWSGTVTIHWLALHNNNTLGGGYGLTPWVGEGTTVGAGTEFLAASDVNATSGSVYAANAGQRIGGVKTVTGLTAGADYNVSMRGRAITAGTASWDDIHVTVVPSP